MGVRNTHRKGPTGMAPKQETQRGLGGLRRVASMVTKLFSRNKGASQDDGMTASAASTAASAVNEAPRNSRSAQQPGRVTRREADIPLDVIGRTYTPPFTGGKAGFRSDGEDHQNDQEFAFGVSDERWNDEDRLTNKSGDPRIGTHRRTYEPGEARPESRE
jgi:hypothetical protein